MSHPPKIDRKSLKNPDEFVKQGRVVLEFLVRQRTRFISVLLVGLLVLLGVFAFDWWEGRNASQHWAKLQTISKTPDADRWGQLTQFYAESKGRPAYMAAIQLADHYYELAKKPTPEKDAKTPPVSAEQSAQSAVDWYTKALAYTSLSADEKQLVMVDRAESYEIAKKYDEALKEYQAAAEIKGEAKALALLGLGRIYELKNEVAKAAETYEKISVEFQSTEYAKLAKGLSRRLKSPLFTEQKG